MNENNAGKIMQAVQTQMKKKKKRGRKEKLNASYFLLYFPFAWVVFNDVVIMQTIHFFF